MKTKNHVTKLALVSSVVALVLCFAMLFGTTYAWFTYVEKSGRNMIIGGDLDVGLEYWDYTAQTPAWADVTENTKLFAENTLWEPGHVEYVVLNVSNLGTLALKYSLRANIYAEKEGTNKEDEQFKLSHYLKVGAVKLDEQNDVTNFLAMTRDEMVASITAPSVLENYTVAEEGVLLPVNGAAYVNANIENEGHNKYVALVVWMPTEVGNEANHKTSDVGDQPYKYAPTIDLGVILEATQTPYEKDSFDENYDAQANGIPDHPEFTGVINAVPQADADAFVTAMQNVEDGDTIMLDGDLTGWRFGINNGKQFTIDLNGHNMTAIAVGNADVTIKNGTIKYTNGQAIEIDATAGNTTHVTIAPDATIEGKWGITMFPVSGTHDGDIVVDMYGTVKGNIFVSGNMEGGNSVVNVYGTIINGTANDIGIAVNGHATVNLFAGCSVTGETGVEVRAGNLNVYDGATVVATGSPASFTPNGNGTTSTGAGIAVAQHTTKLPINVNINGGNISGAIGLYVINPQNNAAADMEKITIRVTGGNIVGTAANISIAEEMAEHINYTNTVA